ncbi:MAG: hypothetical protein AAF998_02745 [Bacteroidota bacterium]
MNHKKDFELENADRSMQIVNDFQGHWVLERAGWDVKDLSYLIDAGIMGGRLNRGNKKHMTSEFYLILAFGVRANAIKQRIDLE